MLELQAVSACNGSINGLSSVILEKQSTSVQFVLGKTKAAKSNELSECAWVATH